MNAKDTPAGRELDALIAERLFGATWREVSGRECLAFGAQNVRILAIRERRRILDNTALPHYSTYIEHTWKVVDLMHERGTDLVLMHRELGGWTAYFRGRPAEQNQNPSKIADTASHAICLAALAAHDTSD